MKDYLYRGEITHTEDTIFRLFRTQYRAFCKRQMLVRLMLGVGTIFLAAFSPFYLWVRGVLLVAGAWLVVSLDFPSQMNADKALEVRRGILPKMEYTFSERDMTVSGEGSMHLKYSRLIRLVEDTNYLYLFTSPEAVCMVERSSVKPEAEGLMTFLAEKTGLEWKTEKSMLMLSLTDLKQILSERASLPVKKVHKKKK